MKYKLEKSQKNELRMKLGGGESSHQITEITAYYRDEKGLELCRKAIADMGFELPTESVG